MFNICVSLTVVEADCVDGGADGGKNRGTGPRSSAWWIPERHTQSQHQTQQSHLKQTLYEECAWVCVSWNCLDMRGCVLHVAAAAFCLTVTAAWCLWAGQDGGPLRGRDICGYNMSLELEHMEFAPLLLNCALSWKLEDKMTPWIYDKQQVGDECRDGRALARRLFSNTGTCSLPTLPARLLIKCSYTGKNWWQELTASDNWGGYWSVWETPRPRGKWLEFEFSLGNYVKFVNQLNDEREMQVPAATACTVVLCDIISTLFCLGVISQMPSKNRINHLFLCAKQCLQGNSRRILLLVNTSNAIGASRIRKGCRSGRPRRTRRTRTRRTCAGGFFWSVYLEPASLRAAEAEQLSQCAEARPKWKCSTVRDTFQTASDVCLCVHSASKCRMRTFKRESVQSAPALSVNKYVSCVFAVRWNDWNELNRKCHCIHVHSICRIITQTKWRGNDCAPFQAIVLWLRFFFIVLLLWCCV